MSFIHWYPGHIAKAEKELKAKLKLVDVLIEVLDSRIPLSSQYPKIEELTSNKPRLILLSKSDLTNIEITKKWKEKISVITKCPVFITDAKSHVDISNIIKKLTELSKPAIDKLIAKGLLPRPARVMVVGMPNVGKSSIINKLIKTNKAKTGAKAGITRQQQWVRVNPKIELLDTPGIIPFKQEDQKTACKLAFVNSIGENAVDEEFVAEKLIEILNEKYPELLKNYYKTEIENPTLNDIAISRNWLIASKGADTRRCANYILSDFREARLGKLTLDEFVD